MCVRRLTATTRPSCWTHIWPEGGSCSNTPGEHFTDNPDLVLPQTDSRRTITQTITTYEGGNVLVGAPQPVAVSVAADARVLPETTTAEQTRVQPGAPQQVELAMLVAQRPLNRGDSYDVVSSITTATVAELRNDTTNYADYIKERYLQLPDTVPQRVFDLADELAQGLSNPYDIAKQYESFLPAAMPTTTRSQGRDRGRTAWTIFYSRSGKAIVTTMPAPWR